MSNKSSDDQVLGVSLLVGIKSQLGAYSEVAQGSLTLLYRFFNHHRVFFVSFFEIHCNISLRWFNFYACHWITTVKILKKATFPINLFPANISITLNGVDKCVGDTTYLSSGETWCSFRYSLTKSNMNPNYINFITIR